MEELSIIYTQMAHSVFVELWLCHCNSFYWSLLYAQQFSKVILNEMKQLRIFQ